MYILGSIGLQNAYPEKIMMIDHQGAEIETFIGQSQSQSRCTICPDAHV